MNYKIERLKERASKYTLESLKRTVEGMEPFGSGMEGKVYRLEEELVVKFRQCRGAGYNQREDNLAEFQRQAVHGAINALADDCVSWNIRIQQFDEWNDVRITSRLVDILASFVDGRKSASILPYVYGKTLGYDEGVTGLFNAYKKLGVAVDNHGENIIPTLGHEVQYVLLETWGVLHPDIFKSIERIAPKRKDEVFEHLARAHLFGATYGYPTPHSEMAGMAVIMYQPINWHDVALVSKANDYKEITYKNLEASLETAREKLSEKEKRQLSQCGLSTYEWEVMGIEAIKEARSLFGPKFIPVKFDWDAGSNMDLYGISPTLFQEFRHAVAKVSSEVQPTIDYAKALMKKR